MAEDRALSLYRENLSARLRQARERYNLTQKEVAAFLGMSEDTYKKNEQRGSLDAAYMERFAVAVGEDPFWILTGRRERLGSNVPAVAPSPTSTKPRRRGRPPKRTAAAS